MSDSNDLSKIFADFESIKHVDHEGNEFWLARELGPMLGYVRFDTFESVVKKAVVAAQNSGANVDNHFSHVRNMVSIGYGNEREIHDFALSRYACYLTAQNASSVKEEVAAAQTYFAVQTRRQEIADENLEALKRVEARSQLTQTEKKFSGVLKSKNVDSYGIAEIRSSGDQILFGGNPTHQMKRRYNIKSSKPLADYLPTVTLKAKDLAAEMTSVNVLQNDLSGKSPIRGEHDNNNKAVRKALLDRGIVPEKLPPEEDIKKVERRINKQRKQLLKKEGK